MAKIIAIKKAFHKFAGKITDKPAITYPFINNKTMVITMNESKLIFLFMILKLDKDTCELKKWHQ